MFPRAESEEIGGVEPTADHRPFASYMRSLGRETFRNDKKKVAKDIWTETNWLSCSAFSKSMGRAWHDSVAS